MHCWSKSWVTILNEGRTLNGLRRSQQTEVFLQACWKRLNPISRDNHFLALLTIPQLWWRHMRLCDVIGEFAGSPASCCNCCLIDTWPTWSWRWLAIAALPLPSETAEEAGYDTSRTASHRDLSWRPFASTYTSLTCQSPSPERMHMLTI